MVPSQFVYCTSGDADCRSMICWQCVSVCEQVYLRLRVCREQNVYSMMLMQMDILFSMFVVQIIIMIINVCSFSLLFTGLSSTCWKYTMHLSQLLLYSYCTITRIEISSLDLYLFHFSFRLGAGYETHIECVLSSFWNASFYCMHFFIIQKWVSFF